VTHTNADAVIGGVAEVLAETVGLVDLVPLVPAPSEPLDKHVVFVPVPDVEAVVDALAAAGAGRIGQYSRAAWTTTGTGTFTPSAAANPTIGRAGVVEQVAEARVEMVAPRALRAAVVAAMRSAHPYEEPAFDVLELAGVRSGTGIGRVGRLPEPMTLREFGTASQRCSRPPCRGCGSRVTWTRRSRAWPCSPALGTRCSTRCGPPGSTPT